MTYDSEYGLGDYLTRIRDEPHPMAHNERVYQRFWDDERRGPMHFRVPRGRGRITYGDVEDRLPYPEFEGPPQVVMGRRASEGPGHMRRASVGPGHRRRYW